jgi:glyoxylase-like metal-dependent hydrolase (beta-lactamase superfamily II)
VPIPFNMTLLKFGNKTVLFDSGTDGQFQPTAGAMIDNMAAAGIKPAQITSVVVPHFHPDHVFGLMSKAPDNTPVFPNATIYVRSTEFRGSRVTPGETIPEWWATSSGISTRAAHLPRACRHGAGYRR